MEQNLPLNGADSGPIAAPASPNAASRQVCMDSLPGVWRRSVLVDENGRDTTSQVLWMQSYALCGDIRLSADHDIRAFAGRLTERDGVFRWDPVCASFALDGPPDDGRLLWEGNALREDGVHVEYLEIWERIASPQPGDYALELVDHRAGRRAIHMTVGGIELTAVGSLDPFGPNTEFGFQCTADLGQDFPNTVSLGRPVDDIRRTAAALVDIQALSAGSPNSGVSTICSHHAEWALMSFELHTAEPMKSSQE